MLINFQTSHNLILLYDQKAFICRFATTTIKIIFDLNEKS